MQKRWLAIIGGAAVVVVLVVGAVLVLSGSGEDAADVSAIVTVSSARTEVLRGQVDFEGDLPAGSEVVVELLSGDEPVNRVVLTDLSAEPYGFELPYAPGQDEGGRVRAVLVSVEQTTLVEGDAVPVT